MAQAETSAPTDIERALAWLIEHSDGVVGLKMDGSLMSWSDVLACYLPWWSASFADKELLRATGEMPKCEECGADLIDGECAVVQMLGGHPDEAGRSE